MNTEKRAMSATTDGKSPREGYEDAAAPAPIRADGQHEAYWVLKEEERAKGFVRPVRDSYRHVGVRPTHPLRDLTDDEKERYAAFNYVAFEAYPPDGRSSVTGRYWTKSQLESGCGAITTMGRALADSSFRRCPSVIFLPDRYHRRLHLVALNHDLTRNAEVQLDRRDPIVVMHAQLS